MYIGDKDFEDELLGTSRKIWHGKSIGFFGADGRWFLQRCYNCNEENGQENYAMAVASGQCAWCKYNPGVGISSRLPDETK